MALIIREDREEVSKRQIQIPQNMKKVFKAMNDLYKNYVDTVQGGRVLKRLARDKKEGPYDNASGDTISVNNAKVILHRQNKFSPNTIQYQLYGGEPLHQLLKKGVEKARKQEKVSPVKPPKPASAKKPSNVNNIKPASVSECRRKISISEEQVLILKENA